jgi:hypothetical protein
VDVGVFLFGCLGKIKNSKAEVVSVEIRRLIDDNWVTDARLALHHSPEGNYRQLPNREKPSKEI